MRRVTIGGVCFAAPYADLVRPLTREERAALERSIVDRGGVLEAGAVVTATVGGSRVVVDGLNRAEIAERHALPCAKTDVGEMTEDAAKVLALDLNAARRQLSAGEQERAARDRAGRVAKMKAEGKSLREIAREEGVSLGQVQRDLGDGRSVSPDTVCYSSVRKASESVTAILAGPDADRLRAAAADVGLPIPAGAEWWPALKAIEEALAGFARGKSQAHPG